MCIPLFNVKEEAGHSPSTSLIIRVCRSVKESIVEAWFRHTEDLVIRHSSEHNNYTMKTSMLRRKAAT